MHKVCLVSPRLESWAPECRRGREFYWFSAGSRQAVAHKSRLTFEWGGDGVLQNATGTSQVHRQVCRLAVTSERPPAPGRPTARHAKVVPAARGAYSATAKGGVSLGKGVGVGAHRSAGARGGLGGCFTLYGSRWPRPAAQGAAGAAHGGRSPRESRPQPGWPWLGRRLGATAVLPIWARRHRGAATMLPATPSRRQAARSVPSAGVHTLVSTARHFYPDNQD